MQNESLLGKSGWGGGERSLKAKSNTTSIHFAEAAAVATALPELGRERSPLLWSVDELSAHIVSRARARTSQAHRLAYLLEQRLAYQLISVRRRLHTLCPRIIQSQQRQACPQEERNIDISPKQLLNYCTNHHVQLQISLNS